MINILEFLALKLKQDVADDISIIQFGSSIYHSAHQSLDIDLMLLSEKISFFSDFESKLFQFRKRLLAGEAFCGFRPDRYSDLISDVELKFRSFKKDNIKYFPVFCFGPFDEGLISHSRPRVNLHIKGVISFSDYMCFCKLLPFHALSLNTNCLVQYGSFDQVSFNNMIVFADDEYRLWCRSLLLRVSHVNDNISAFKCYRKLCIIISLKHGFTSTIAEDLKANIADIFPGLPLDVITNKSLYKEILNSFKKLYSIAMQDFDS